MIFTITQGINIIRLIIIFIIAKKYYKYKCDKNKEKEEEEKEEEEYRILELEIKFKFYSDDTIFYLTVCKILITNNLLDEYINLDKMMDDSIELYNNNNSNFCNECYKHGIKPRFLEYIKNNKKNI